MRMVLGQLPSSPTAAWPPPVPEGIYARLRLEFRLNALNLSANGADPRLSPLCDLLQLQ